MEWAKLVPCLSLLYLRRREDDDRLGDVDNHPDCGEGGLEVLGVGGPDGDGHHADVEAPVEGADEVDPRRVDKGHVVPGVETALC